MVHEVEAIQEHFYVPFPASEVSGKLSCPRHKKEEVPRHLGTEEEGGLIGAARCG